MPHSPPGDLPIRELSERTGLSPALLRVWETRYGVPRPHRLESGHRRYSPADVALIQSILSRRDAGIRLETAISQALSSAAPATSSVFAELRRRHPQLAPQRLHKSTVLALTWAIEDECCAQAQRPILFGAFQEERFYRKALPRWNELARVARATIALAEFSGPPDADERPTRVPLAPDAPMGREWVVVCDAPDLPVALTAWEVPGQGLVPDRDRVFEAIWTVDRDAVRDAARTCAHTAAEAGAPGAAELVEELAGSPAGSIIDPARTSALFSRFVGYLDRANARA